MSPWDIRGAPSDLRGGGWAVLLCRIIFLVALGLQDFFWPMLGFFLVVALLYDFFPHYFALKNFFFGSCPPPFPEIWWSAPYLPWAVGSTGSWVGWGGGLLVHVWECRIAPCQLHEIVARNVTVNIFFSKTQRTNFFRLDCIFLQFCEINSDEQFCKNPC